MSDDIMDTVRLPQVSREFIERLEKRCVEPSVKPETHRDKIMWEAARYELMQEIKREAGTWKSEDIKTQTSASSKSVCGSCTRNERTTVGSHQTLTTSQETSKNTSRQSVIVRLWRGLKGFFSGA